MLHPIVGYSDMRGFLACPYMPSVCDDMLHTGSELGVSNDNNIIDSKLSKQSVAHTEVTSEHSSLTPLANCHSLMYRW